MQQDTSTSPPGNADGTSRRLDGWGFTGEGLAPSPALLDWLRARLGSAEPFATFEPGSLAVSPPAQLPELGCRVSQASLDRFAYSRGRGFPDLVRLRSATVTRLPDAVASPAGDTQLEALLAVGESHGLKLIPWGGGTSVTGGVNPPPGTAPVVTVDLRRFSGLEDLDPTSGLATFGAGTLGPQVETALAARGFTLGHYPQSWELSTLGGWIATRSAGQESLGYGRIEALVAGLDLSAPAGRLRIPALPASAAGPDLRQLVLGSEGRFGIVTRAVVRVRRLPESRRVEAILVPGWHGGVDAARELVQADVPLALLRLSDAPETEVAMRVGLGASAWAAWARRWLRFRGIGEGGCLMLLGAVGSHETVAAAFEDAWARLRRHGAVSLGRGPGTRWLADRFRHPYLRDGLLDAGYATETLETAAPWSRLEALREAVGAALDTAAGDGERPSPVLCHLSHPYRDGASLYFTFFFRCPRDPDQAIHRWARIKRRATRAIVETGGTLSHHHGVGSWHAPWYRREAGDDGWRALRRVAEELDPNGILNPHVLLDPVDRLEE